MVIADDSVDGELCATDLLGQAEHGPDSPAILITNSRALAEYTLREIERLLTILPTAAIAAKAWEAYGEIVLCADEAEMVRVADKSAFFVAQACVRTMLAAGRGGSLIHVGSQMGHVGSAGRSLYCASKWALKGMSKAFALDLASGGIRSNTIAPTFVETPLTLPFLEDPDFKATSSPGSSLADWGASRT